jgi:hypothetical protein
MGVIYLISKILRMDCHVLNLNKRSLSVEIHLGNLNLEIILLNIWHMDGFCRIQKANMVKFTKLLDMDHENE